jgi:hypothetical protein
MKRILVGVLLGLVLILSAATPVFAASSQDVTVTAAPLYLSITNTPSTWTINGIHGSGLIEPDTIYYADGGSDANDTTAPSATVEAGECYFEVTNGTGATTCDLTVTCGSFTGGGADMTNSGDGSNGATTYGMYCWYEGMTYSNKVIVKTSGSAEMYSTGLAADASLKWGVEIETRTDDWSSGTSSTATLTITATAH